MAMMMIHTHPYPTPSLRQVEEGPAHKVGEGVQLDEGGGGALELGSSVLRPPLQHPPATLSGEEGLGVGREAIDGEEVEEQRVLINPLHGGEELSCGVEEAEKGVEVLLPPGLAAEVEPGSLEAVKAIETSDELRESHVKERTEAVPAIRESGPINSILMVIHDALLAYLT